MEGLNRAQRRQHQGGKTDTSIVYDPEGTRLGYTVLHRRTVLNSAKVCDTPALAKLSDYSDLRGACPHEGTDEVVVSAWYEDGLWWPSVLCRECRQLVGRRDPYFSIEGDMLTLGKGTDLMRAEWQFWQASGWPREGKPRFGIKPPGFKLGLPPVMWVHPYRLFNGWQEQEDGSWQHPLLAKSLVVSNRLLTDDDVEMGFEWEGTVAEGTVDDGKVVQLVPKPPTVWEFRIEKKAEGGAEIYGPFAERIDAIEGALMSVFDVQTSLALVVARSLAQNRESAIEETQTRHEAQSQIIMPPGVSKPSDS